MDNIDGIMSESLVTPVIFHGRGCCPICGSNLVVHERECNTFLLNNDGSVNRFIDDAYILSIAKCFTCDKQYDVNRFNGTYRLYTPAADLFAYMDYIESEKAKAKGKYKINGNPLCE